MKFRINESKTKLLLTDSSREEYQQLKLSLNPHVFNYRFMQRFKLGVWDGKVDFFNNGQINFGLWKEIQNVCMRGSQIKVTERTSSFGKTRESLPQAAARGLRYRDGRELSE